VLEPGWSGKWEQGAREGDRLGGLQLQLGSAVYSRYTLAVTHEAERQLPACMS
jgi:hypothetical protein